jgi:nucleoside-diphosphate-sugar epimerase
VSTPLIFYLPPANPSVVCPPWIFGPFAPGFEHIVPTPDFAAFSTNGFVYQLLRAENTNYHYSPGVLDVRDVARAHIAGLHPLTPNHPKRVPIVSPYDADFRDAIRYISEARPELRGRLADPSTVPVWPSYKLAVDLKPAEEAFGIERESYKTWRETILDAVDRFLDLERLWKSKGLEFEVPSAPPM